MAVKTGEWGKNQRMRVTWETDSPEIGIAFRHIPETLAFDVSKYPAEMHHIAAMYGFAQIRFADANAQLNDGRTDAEKCEDTRDRLVAIDAALRRGEWESARAPSRPKINAAVVIAAFAEVYTQENAVVYGKFVAEAERAQCEVQKIAEVVVGRPEIAAVYARMVAEKRAATATPAADDVFARLMA